MFVSFVIRAVVFKAKSSSLCCTSFIDEEQTVADL